MRILIDLTSLDDNFSGIERYALNISQQMILNDRENEYTLVFKNRVHSDFSNINYENVNYKVIKGKNKLIFNQILLPWNLYALKVDKYLFFAFPSPILFRKKGIINTIHDLTSWDYPETMKFHSRMYFKFSIINAINISEIILTVSEFSKKRLEEKFKIDNTYVIYNGISKVFLEPEQNYPVKEKYNLPDKYIMCLCTLEPRKNIPLLINAYLELIESEKINSKLVLVGRRGWKIENYLESISNKYSDNIIITGFVEDNDLPYIYKHASIFIFPSLYEGFGIPVIEAMYMGVPVICSNSSSLPEVVGDYGILFNNNDKSDLKDKITMLESKDKDSIIKLTRHARERALKFNWATEAKKLINLLSI